MATLTQERSEIHGFGNSPCPIAISLSLTLSILCHIYSIVKSQGATRTSSSMWACQIWPTSPIWWGQWQHLWAYRFCWKLHELEKATSSCKRSCQSEVGSKEPGNQELGNPVSDLGVTVVFWRHSQRPVVLEVWTMSIIGGDIHRWTSGLSRGRKCSIYDYMQHCGFALTISTDSHDMW